jgi:hypothetical protein
MQRELCSSFFMQLHKYAKDFILINKPAQSFLAGCIKNVLAVVLTKLDVEGLTEHSASTRNILVT